ncbi:MAG TPA: DUF3426 domain-containing protein [Gammaproteobacteria bacterium]|nr:DUF3426 domain-containing protein [Gammaproteobacteria bacterium]
MTGDTGEGAAGGRYYTQCPGCLTLFRLDDHHLAAADGEVRCGLCGEVFDARRRLHRQLPRDLVVDPDILRLLAEGQSTPAPGADDEPPGPPAADPARVERGAKAPARGTPVVTAPADWRQTTALELEDVASARPRRHWPWALGCLVLALTLAGQLLWFQRDSLARDPRWRPFALQACSYLGCDLPLRRRPDRIEVTARTLRTDPDMSDVLVFDATVVNRAPEPQPWPQIGLRLSSLNGQTVGQRWFLAKEYLADTARARKPMPSGEPVAVHLRFRDPGSGADNFELSFR